ALDVFWFARRTEARIRRWVRFERPPAEVLGAGANVCLTGHLGNWEVLGLACAVEGYPLASVAMPLKNPEVDVLFNKLRQSTGQVIIPREGAVRTLLRLLHGGRNVALLLDQNTPPSEGGLFMEFFGRPVTVSTAAVFLAARTGAGIVFGFCLPDARGAYRVRIPAGLGAPSPHPGEEQVREWTERITRLYEEEVRRCPECWLWTYKRWKYVRPGDDASGYPYYAAGKNNGRR
ncbi:MAG: lysophospholipid acyltransferase family protein, partial [Verrucomicrobia bacterium]|nr:lysophospholipid acyltransferase family protein [Verrucomicrobiota bacterium]